ncbi:hypothetical protein LCGC14_2759610, partial [marine sediment metagenome]
MVRRMSELEVHQVKMLICEGFSQVQVARVVGVSAAHVSRICAGDVHRDVPWPNPAVGEKLMRGMAFRGEQDQVQAQLVSGVAQAPQVVQATESEAIEQARQQAANREEWKKEIRRRAAIVEKEMDEEYLKDITTVGEAV